MIRFLDLQKINAQYNDEVKVVHEDVLNSGLYILGNKINEFESAFALYNGTKYCIGTGNGLDALMLILRAYDFEKGSEVIVPANTYIATILAIIHTGLKPVLVEPDPLTYNIDPIKAEAAITSNTVAIMAVHLYGRCANMPALQQLRHKYDIKIFEDAAQAHGAMINGTKVGNLSDAAAFSFYPSKNLGAYGDAGAVCTNDDGIADKIAALRNYGSETKNVNKYLGFNSRMDELQAAILNIKLNHLDVENVKRRKIALQYLNEIKNPNVVLPEHPLDENEHVWHLFVIRCQQRDELQHYLKENGIETQIHYPIPPHKQEGMSPFNNLSFPITEKIHREVLSLPIGAHLNKIDVKTVISAMQNFNR